MPCRIKRTCVRNQQTREQISKRVPKRKPVVEPNKPYKSTLLCWYFQNQDLPVSLRQLVCDFALPKTHYYVPLFMAGSGVPFEGDHGVWVQQKEKGDALQTRMQQTFGEVQLVTKNLEPLVGSRLVRTQLTQPPQLWVVMRAPEPEQWWARLNVGNQTVCVGVSEFDHRSGFDYYQVCALAKKHKFSFYRTKRTATQQQQYLGKSIILYPYCVRLSAIFWNTCPIRHWHQRVIGNFFRNLFRHKWVKGMI